jgi:hypothetical protein
MDNKDVRIYNNPQNRSAQIKSTNKMIINLKKNIWTIFSVCLCGSVSYSPLSVPREYIIIPNPESNRFLAGRSTEQLEIKIKTWMIEVLHPDSHQLCLPRYLCDVPPSSKKE